MSRKAIEILLVEDNPADVELTRIGLKKGSIRHNLHVVSHGGQAISFLRGEGQYHEAPRPDLVLLDWFLPVVNGRRVLEVVKQDDALEDIPVVVLTTSLDERDMLAAHSMRANAYLTKPVNAQEFVELVHNTVDRWVRPANLAARTSCERATSLAR